MDLPGSSDYLNQALLDYEAHVGGFMQTGAEINTLKSRAAAYTSSKDPAVVSKAQAVVQEANAALANFNDIQSAALSTAQQAGALKSQLDSDSQWKNLMNADTSVLGTAVLSAVTSKATQVYNMAAALVAIESRMDDHLNKVMPTLRSDEDDLENLAQGKGISGVAHSLVSTYTGAVSGVVDKLSSSLGLGDVGKYLAIGAVVLVLGPVALQGLVGALAPRPLRNPRRRRRSRRRS